VIFGVPRLIQRTPGAGTWFRPSRSSLVLFWHVLMFCKVDSLDPSLVLAKVKVPAFQRIIDNWNH